MLIARLLDCIGLEKSAADVGDHLVLVGLHCRLEEDHLALVGLHCKLDGDLDKRTKSDVGNSWIARRNDVLGLWLDMVYTAEKNLKNSDSGLMYICKNQTA